MTITLALDTSTRVAVGVATTSPQPAVLAVRHVDGPTAHVEQLMPCVTAALAEAGRELADVDRIVVGLGPGPFTGLRVGIVTGHTLASVLGVPWRGVCSLDALGVTATGEAVAVTDARRKEVYWARYRGGARVDGPHVGAAETVPELPAVGGGLVNGGVLALHGFAFPDEGSQPLYLRAPDAVASGGPKSVLP